MVRIDRTASSSASAHWVRRLPTVLIVEDEALLALELGDALLSSGAVTIGPLSTVESALATIQNVEIDGAILDIGLNGDYCFAVADVLRERGTPFLFYTAVDPRIVPLVHRSAPCLMKPLAPKAVVGHLFQLLEH